MLKIGLQTRRAFAGERIRGRKLKSPRRHGVVFTPQQLNGETPPRLEPD
jgi:hypothetical protein